MSHLRPVFWYTTEEGHSVKAHKSDATDEPPYVVEIDDSYAVYTHLFTRSDLYDIAEGFMELWLATQGGESK